MAVRKKIFFVLALVCHKFDHGQVRIVLSAALTETHYEFRKAQYIKSFNILTSLGYQDVYVIEALKKQGPTFLDLYSQHVFYATTNNPLFKNQGTNEARTCLEGIKYFKFDPEDMILKITGRYQLLSDYFIKLVSENPGFDTFVKFSENGDVFTACFAMRCKFFQEMYSQIDFDLMEKNHINLETEVSRYIIKKVKEGNFKVYYTNKLDLEANLYGSSACPGVAEVILHL